MTPAIFASAYAAVVAQAQERPPVKRPYIPVYGADVELYFPASARVRALFGDTWTGFGPGLGPVFGRKGLSLRPDLQILNSQRRRDAAGLNQAVLGILRAQVRYDFEAPAVITPQGPRFRTFAPFVGGSLDVMYADVTSRTAGVSVKRLGGGATVFAGTSIGLNAFIVARYQFLTEVSGLDFSGASLSLGFRF